MGILLRFPDEKRAAATGSAALAPGRSASVIILPVIRIERHGGELPVDPASVAGNSGLRRRKRRARPS